MISTRVRLARNVTGFHFPGRATPHDRGAVERLISDRIHHSAVLGESHYLDLAACTELDRQLLVERHLISRDHASPERGRSVSFAASEAASLMVNEEDHLRIQVIHSGLALQRCWEEADTIEQTLGRELEYSFSERFGYLTSCPTNVGTGLRASIMVHLPALVMTQQIEKVFESLSKINLAVRGLHGEGTNGTGDFYQISNQVTLGQSEGDILLALEQVVPQVIRYERSIRETLLNENKVGLEDRVWRALGLLRHARSIKSEEALEQLSFVRLGVNLGLISDIDMTAINELFVCAQPAHLQKSEGRALEASERRIARAALIRTRLN